MLQSISFEPAPSKREFPWKDLEAIIVHILKNNSETLLLQAKPAAQMETKLLNIEIHRDGEQHHIELQKFQIAKRR